MAKHKAYNGDGCIRHRKDKNIWECNLMIGYHEDGRRKTKTFTGCTQAEVKKKLRAYQQSVEDGILADMDLTFGEWADKWFAQHAEYIKPTTVESYRYTLRILKNQFGRRKLREIKVYDIEQFMQKLRREGRSGSYLSKCRAMAYQIFERAEANDLVPQNPVRLALKMRKRPPQRKECFTAEETRRLLDQLPETPIGRSIRLLLGTGMRSQELLALEPRHITEDGAFIGGDHGQGNGHHRHAQESVQQAAIRRYAEAFSCSREE